MAGTPRTRFTKPRRLLSRADFDRVQNGRAVRRASSTHFLVLLTPRVAAATGARLGIIASRRVGSSVRRNRAKRLIREWFRAAASGLGDDDMVVVVKTGAEKLSAAKAAAELAATAARAAKAAPTSDSRPPRAKKRPATKSAKPTAKGKRPRT